MIQSCLELKAALEVRKKGKAGTEGDKEKSV